MNAGDLCQQLSQNGFCLIEACDSSSLVPMELPRYTVFALCSQGEMEVELNMECFHLERGMCMCYSSLTQLRTLRQSNDLSIRLLVLSQQFSLDISMGIDTAMLQQMQDQPVIMVDDEPLWAMVNALYDALSHYSRTAAVEQTRQVSGPLVRSLIILLGELLQTRAPLNAGRVPFTMTDNFFRHFVRLVTEHVKQQHEVTFYASQLNITPKYLSEICKLKSGRKAKEIISMLLLRDIKRDLVMSGKSLKSLAEDYHFADQSSLGKFFRKMTGLSPLHYKQHVARNKAT